VLYCKLFFVRLDVFTAASMKHDKNSAFFDVTPRGSCTNRHFGGRIASIMTVRRIGVLGTLAVTSN
jgi:hypothetical protein